MSIPWLNSSASQLKSISGLCIDIDDTLSTSGKLTAEAYQALWSLYQQGFIIVPVTGRPAGWCDQIARFWPVHAVVGENGAFTFFVHEGKRKRIDTLQSSYGSVELKEKLLQLKNELSQRFSQIQWASDQSYREYDLAVDICEDVPPWSKEEIEELLNFCKVKGAHAKLSSIHVNIWYGDYDKLSGFQFWMDQGMPGLPHSHSQRSALLKRESWIYVGDSPNDEPMFKGFPHSVGVANLKPYLSLIQHLPTWITSEKSGKGFCQVAQKLLEMKKFIKL